MPIVGWMAFAIFIASGAFVFYRHESDATAGTFDLIESRKRDHGKWIMKGVVSVPTVVAIAWIAGYGGLARINTHLSGPASRHEAVIAGPDRFSYAWYCGEIEVRLPDGAEHWICAKRRAFGEIVPANSRCAAVGARAEVAETSTALGKTFVLLSIGAPDC